MDGKTKEEREESSIMEIVNAEYHEIEELGEKSTEELIAETNTLYQQMQTIGVIGLQMAAEAGRRLSVIKERVGHGNWGDWCQKNLQFSARKAQNMMKLASEIQEKNGVFSNPQTFANIEISKVYEILAAPEEVQKAVLENPQTEEMNVREFKDEIKRLKAELETERAKETVNESEEELKRAQAEIESLTAQVQSLQEGKSPEEWEKELQELKDKIEAERRKAEKATEKLKKAKEEIETEKEKAAEAAGAKAKAEAEAEMKKQTAKLASDYDTAKAEIEKLSRKLANSSASEIAEFKIKADLLQKDFAACRNSVTDMRKKDPEQAAKMQTALRTVMQALLKEIEYAE